MPVTTQAAGTAAGTVISTSAEVSFHFGGERASLVSNVVAFRIDEVLDVSVAAAPDELPVAPGQTGRVLAFTVGNAGNSRERIALQLLTSLGGVDFVVDPASTPLYLDLDANGALTAADVAYVPGSNEPELAADGAIGVLAIVDVPATATAGQRSAAELVASAMTGTGAPGTVFAGQGEAGVDAVLGIGGGRASGQGRLLASLGDLQVQKSLAVNGVAGAREAVAGSTVTYTLRVLPYGPVSSTRVTVVDSIPVGTTYVANSIKVDGQALTDAVDGDAGALLAGASPAIQVELGPVGSNDVSRVVEFSVLVN